MFCPKCGTENPDQAKFCGSCGAPINIVTEKPVPDLTYRQTQPAAVSSELKIGIIIVSIIIPLVGIIMGWIYMADPNPSKKAAGKTWMIVGVIAAILYCLIIYSADYGY